MINKKLYIQILAFMCLLVSSSLFITPVNSVCVTSSEATGLITVGSSDGITGGFGTNIGGQSPCVLDPKASLNPREKGIPVDSYEALKTIYFTKANPASDATFTKTELTCTACSQVNIPLTGKDRLYLVPENLTITATDGAILGINTQTGVIFVNGDLTINTDITSTAFNKGLIFVVKGQILIHPLVGQIDAVLISEGNNGVSICTAYNSDNTCPADLIDPSATKQLLVKGSFISLSENNLIRFRRNLASNDTTPAEKIIAQPKYLAILRDIFSSSWQKWSELP